MFANTDIPPMEDQTAHLERALIEQYIFMHGVEPARLRELPPDERTRLLREAVTSTALKLAEVESRAHYVQGLHGHH